MTAAACLLVVDDLPPYRPRRRLESDTWLSRERRRRNITQARLASDLGITPSGLSTYETGRNRMPDDMATRLAEVWDLDELYVRKMLGLWVPSEGTPQASADQLHPGEELPDNVLLLPPGARLTPEQKRQVERYVKFVLVPDDEGETPTEADS